MNILGIETSCDETAIAVVCDGHHVRANLVASQTELHGDYGGVIPELAAREHLRALRAMFEGALEKSGLEMSDLDAIAVTHSPGLLPALLVGLSYAKGLAAALRIPLVGVNHIDAHIFAAFLENENRKVFDSPSTWPIVVLVVSGGHTLLAKIDQSGKSTLLGRTLDDAAGEAFDKGATILELGYPGGPLIDKLSGHGNPQAVAFPRALTGGSGSPLSAENRLNFSFSGVKTSLLYYVRRQPQGWQQNTDETTSHCTSDTSTYSQAFYDTVASYQEAIVDVLVRKTMWAAVDHGARTVLLCGGVACNRHLRSELAKVVKKESKLNMKVASPGFCTDNAAMIAGLGYYNLAARGPSPLNLDAEPRLGDLSDLAIGVRNG